MSVKIGVEGFSPSMTETSLMELFSRYGSVTAVKIERGADGQSIGIAEVVMTDHGEALAAIEGLHKIEVDGKRLLVFRLMPSP
jgi:RNA recognition motif-containing protein